jgi:hypothetical protein
MALLPGIESNDPAFAALVSEWLLESQMPIPAGFRLQLLVTEQVPVPEDPRTIYTQADVEIRAGEPLGWVHVGWGTAPAMARIEEHAPVASIYLSPAAIADPDRLFRSFLLIVMIFLWRRDGRYHMHGGTAVDSRGRGWLLVGHSGTGKSTTIALLASRGWQVGTDDIAFLTAANGRAAVLGFRSPIALRPGGYGLLACEGGVNLERRGKTGFQPEDLGGAWLSSVEPEFVVFTSLGGSETRLTPVPAKETIKSLLQWSPWVMFEATAAQEHLDLLAQLGRQARCYQATLAPDLFAAPRALEDFLP